jgi:translation initiation factor IF-1
MPRRYFKPKKKGETTKEEGIRLDAIIVENLPNATFKVKLVDMGNEVMAYVSGKMRKHWIKLMPGDRVKVEFSPYDMERARIVERFQRP